jgi:hypothetical protein
MRSKLKMFDQLSLRGYSVHFRCRWLLLGVLMALLHLMHIKTHKKTVRVQMYSNSLRLLFILALSLAALDTIRIAKTDSIQPPARARHPSLHSPALQAAQVFYEPCPPEEDESSHITQAAAARLL